MQESLQRNIEISKERCYSKLSAKLTNNKINPKCYRNLDPNKAHEHDEISIRMLQICDKTICKPLYLIFSSCMESDILPSQWKMANVVPA